METYNTLRLSEKATQKIEQICRTAAKVFSTKGYINATLIDVSLAARLSKGGIYHYFGSKEELLAVILSRHMDRFFLGLKEELERANKPHEKIRAFILHDIQNYCQNLHESRLLLHDAHNLPQKYYKIVKDKEKEYVRILESIVKSLMRGSPSKSGRVKLVTYCLLGMINWPYRWYNPKGRVPPEELADQIYEIFVGRLQLMKEFEGRPGKSIKQDHGS